MKRFVLLTAVSFGMALSSSCYSLIGNTLGDAPIWQWTTAIGIAMLIMNVVASAVGELTSRFPGAIGVRTLIASTLGPRLALFASYLYLLVVPAVACVESFFLTKLIEVAFPNIPGLPVVGALFLILLIINCLGYTLSIWAQLVLTTALLIGSLTLSGAVLAPHGSGPPVLSSGTPWDLGSLASMTLTAIFLFMGFEWVTASGRRREEYRRLIPGSMYLSIGLLAAVYVTFSWAVHLTSLPDRDTALLGVAVARCGGIGKKIAFSLGLLAATSTLNAGLLGGARMSYALAREGALPRWLSSTWLPIGTPVVALVTLCLISALVSLIGVRAGLALEFAMLAALVECLVYALLLVGAFKNRAQIVVPEHFHSGLPRAVFMAAATLLVGTCGAVLYAQSHFVTGVLLLAVIGALLFTGLVEIRRKTRVT